MTTEQKREQVIHGLADLLKTTPFSVEYKAVKKPKGIKVIIEVTQEFLQSTVKKIVTKREAETAAIS